MSTHLITGFAGKEHITSADQGSFNAAVMGGGEFALERGEQFRCQVISNNKVRIYDGDAMMQGRHIIIDRNTYEETTHDNGTQGYKRIDLIVLTYEKNAASSVETVKLEVIKGLPSESDPVVPEYTKGDILNSGASKNQMPLYQIPFDGLSIGEPVKLFSTVPTLETMKKEVDDEVDAKKEELDDKFKSMIASNATDWGMIGNYGEFTADAKTVGEEFSKVNYNLKDLDNRLGYAVTVSFAYKVITETWNKGIHNVVFDVPKLEGYVPMFFVANRHSWYPNALHPMLNAHFFTNSNAETFTVQYSLEADSLKLDGGNFSALIVYRKRGN